MMEHFFISDYKVLCCSVSELSQNIGSSSKEQLEGLHQLPSFVVMWTPCLTNRRFFFFCFFFFFLLLPHLLLLSFFLSFFFFSSSSFFFFLSSSFLSFFFF
jgi:hypothetical protein